MGKGSRRRRSRSRSRGRRRSRSAERRHRSEHRKRHHSSSSGSEPYRHRNSSGHRRRGRRYSRSSSESRSRSRERSHRKRRRRRRLSSASWSPSRSTSRERTTSSSARKPKADRASGGGREGNGGSKETGKPSARDFSKDIPGYSDMTPAERVKAKLKLMLERSTSGLAAQTQKEATPPAPPTASQLASIESEDFTVETFVSHRTAGNHATPSPTPQPSSTQTHVVDPSEYQPQVVILEDRLSAEEEVPTSQSEEQSSPAPEAAGRPAVDKTQRWLLKLQKMRGKFEAPPSD